MHNNNSTYFEYRYKFSKITRSNLGYRSHYVEDCHRFNIADLKNTKQRQK